MFHLMIRRRLPPEPAIRLIRKTRALPTGVALLVVLATPLVLHAASAPNAQVLPADPYLIQFERMPSPAEMTTLGRELFFEPAISGSAKLSCASCHDPGKAFGPPNALAVQRGGLAGSSPGVRAVPSLRYREAMPAFTEHYHEGEDVNGDQGPTGGYTWDGRAATVHDQARLPLFSSYEMANSDVQSLAKKIRSTKLASALSQAFGASTLMDDRRTVAAAIFCLEVFQQEPKTFYPFTSKYDQYLRGKVQLSKQEQRGMELYENPKKGNCALCHPNGTQEGAFPMFTDNGYIAVGVPRNLSIPANRDPRYFDLGLCGPYRDDLRAKIEYCGMFRTPSLRNVATRRTFFHNGVIHDLTAAVAFYASRDSHPERWYPKGAKFNDLPAQFHANLNSEAPFGAKRGEADALTPSEIDDIVAFLKTLTDADQTTAVPTGKAGNL
jgi:cytochrome c peroxidase